MTDGHVARRIVPTFLLMTLVVGCRDVTLPEPSAALRVRPECPPPSDVDFFYPPGAVYEKNLSRDKYQGDLASQFLRAAGARSLSCGDSAVEGYRLLLMPSYDPAFVITLSLVNRTWRIDTAEFSDPRTEPAWPITRSRKSRGSFPSPTFQSHLLSNNLLGDRQPSTF